MRTIAVAACALLLVTTPAPAQNASTSPLPSADLPPELERVLRDYEAAWQARDADALTALFAPDGFVLVPGRPPVRGARAIREHHTGRDGPLSLRAFHFAAEDSVGYIIGGYSPMPDLPDGGRFVLALRRGPDGRWMIVGDMDNSNR